MIGILAATSAGVIDGIFIGSFVGSAALSAVNISMPAWFGDTGIFIAVPVAEAPTLALALILVVLNRPSRIVAALEPNQVQQVH